MCMKKIIITGPSGAGKSTLAKKLAKKYSVAHIELDALCWMPNWKMREEKDALRALRKRLEQHADGWTLCGNFSASTKITWPQADIVVWLDFPLYLCLWRVIKRTFHRCFFTSEIVCGNNRESLRLFFSSNSIIYWCVRSYFSWRKKMPVYMQDPAYKQVCFLRFTSPQDVEQWLKSL